MPRQPSVPADPPEPPNAAPAGRELAVRIGRGRSRGAALRRALAVAALALLALAWSAAAGEARAPLTPSGWRVQPAGSEIGVSRLTSGFQGPLGSALSPDGNRLLSVSSGAARVDSTDLFDLRQRAHVGLVPYDARSGSGEAVFYGVVFSPDGRRAWASGGGQNVVHVYDVAGDSLTETGQIPVPNFPAGLAYAHTPLGDRIYVANNLGGPINKGNPPGHQVTVIDPATGSVAATVELGRALTPLGVTFERRARKAYVTNWLGRSVSVIDAATQVKTKDIALSPRKRPLVADHPSAITENPKRDEVYTANANSDTVSVLDTQRDKVAATIDVGVVPGGPKGATPDGLDVSPNGRTLYVALAGENAVAVVDLARRRLTGFIPTSWYPTDVKATPNGRSIVVTNTNGSGAGPNPCGPTSARTNCAPSDPNGDPSVGRDSQYSGSMTKGSVTVVRLPRDARGLAKLTRSVVANNQLLARRAPKPQGLANIKHVIYVPKENRTYDQVFGDLGRGNGDPSLTLFNSDSAPNHHALARGFTAFDNFYADAEVSADGHNWITQANATDYVDKTWPIVYSPKPRGRQRWPDFEDMPFEALYPTEPLASDPSLKRSASAQTVGYLWDQAFQHHVSYRDYGEFTQNVDCSQPSVSHTTHLGGRFGSHVDDRYPGWNLGCSDHLQREPEWEREFRKFEKNGKLPALSIVRFPNDHTRGTSPQAATPASYMADNDLALGRLVDVVSHSRYWKSTAILVTEDDAQNGPDHVDAHRTVALVVSPYTRRRHVDSTHYDSASMLATIEDLIGLSPMSIFDQRATRMWPAFTSRPNYAPYTAATPSVVPFGEPNAPTNASTAPLAATSSRWNFRAPDATPEIQLNKAIWKSIKGRRSVMPAPRHDVIIGSRPIDDEGDLPAP